ncbi:MAG: LytTR family DNA-binding domain-containing protein, partial [Cyclobacteriaceae bacterium]
IFCQEGKNLISYQKLSHLEEVLPNEMFIRAHRSYIVSLNKITSYTNTDIGIGKLEIPIGASYKDHLLNVVSRFQV